MSAGDQNYSRAAQFKCLSDSTVPISVWIVPSRRAQTLYKICLEQKNDNNSRRRVLVERVCV